MDIKKAIQRGWLTVNLPVLAIMFTGLGLPLLLNIEILFPIGFIGGFGLAWLWWSFAIVKWRTWAYEHVKSEDIPELKRQAIRANLTWPDDSVFKKTEIKTTKESEREKHVEREANAEMITERSPAQDWVDAIPTLVKIFVIFLGAIAVLSMVEYFF